MPLGKSGGRSAQNRLGDGALRRATPRERDYIDPPGHRPDDTQPNHDPIWVWTPRGERFLSFVAWSSSITLCGLTSICIAKLFGIL